MTVVLPWPSTTCDRCGHDDDLHDARGCEFILGDADERCHCPFPNEGSVTWADYRP